MLIAQKSGRIVECLALRVLGEVNHWMDGSMRLEGAVAILVTNEDGTDRVVSIDASEFEIEEEDSARDIGDGDRQHEILWIARDDDLGVEVRAQASRLGNVIRYFNYEVFNAHEDEKRSCLVVHLC